MENAWLYSFKRRIIAGLSLLLLVSTTISMVYITLMTRNYLLQNNAVTTRELAGSISSSLRSLMLRRSPQEIQSTITQLGHDKHIARIFILNLEGRVAFSSNLAENGKQLSLKEESCRDCHRDHRIHPSSTTSIVKLAGGDVQRIVTVLYNDPECYGCHSPANRINGKLIIDCSLSPTYTLIGNIRFVILASASLCLLIIFLIIPCLSRSFDRYINQVLLKSNELSMIYAILVSVSKRIDLEDLKTITLDILENTFAADEVNLVLPLQDGHYRVVSRTRGERERRKLPEPGGMLAVAIKRWQAGELQGKEVSIDRTTVFLPIAQGDIQLALIAINSPKNPFSGNTLRLVDSVISPISIAFENARLYLIASTDELTGLFTVRHFRNCLDRQRDLFERHGEKFALLLIDIDNFKEVNDTHGHSVGDLVLKRVGSSIAASVRGSDLAFRYGGEKFAAILPNTGQVGGLQVAERIRAAVEAGITSREGAQIRSTASIGLSLFPENTTTLRELVTAADNALYMAKVSGKNCVVRSKRSADKLIVIHGG